MATLTVSTMLADRRARGCPKNWRRSCMLIRRIVMKFFLLAMVVSFSTMLKAQDVASLTGQVTDTSGAVIPGVNVLLVNTTTNATFKAVTNGAGEYTMSSVPPGPGYKLTFTREGFKSAVINDLY